MIYQKIKGNLVHKSAVIDWKNLIIGKNNYIGPYVVIGGNAQHPKKKILAKSILEIIIQLMNIQIFIDQLDIKKKLLLEITTI